MTGRQLLTGRLPRERGDASFETGLVTVRRVHVAELVVRRDRATAGARRYERAVVQLLPRREALEVPERLRPEPVLPPVDVPRGLQRLAREAGAREQRSVRTDRVRVLRMDLARAHVHAVGGREAPLFRLLAQEGHLVVDAVAGVARAADAGPGRGHARAVQRLALRAHRRQRNHALGEGALLADDGLERHF